MDDAWADALCGGTAATERFAFGSATVGIGDAGTLIIVEAGDALDKSCVWNSDEVRLLGPAPTPVRQRLLQEPWERGTGDAKLPVHLTVRNSEGLLYLGTGSVTRAGTVLHPGRNEHVLTDCVLRLHSPLNKADLDRVRPPLSPTDLPNLEWLRDVEGNRASALAQFITGWHPAVSETVESPSVPAPPVDLPDGLRQFYRLAQQRPRCLGVQNRVLPLPKLQTDPKGEMLVFGEENQGGFFWSLLWTLDGPEADPTVWFREYDEPAIAEQEPLSGFLIQFSLYEASMGADYVALSCQLNVEQVDRLAQELLPVPLRPFWPGAPTRFYVAPGLVLHVSDEGGDNGFSAWAGATHRSALAPLSDVPVEWDQFDG
ncbi:hypothetical protein ABZ372_05980 [Streptomyces sp. NPDC005921]|uniref:hypothetical protein n=1 Tax=Streptomyces sp. NPDC005827 TaxID=3157070 RepID=UPI0033F01002